MSQRLVFGFTLQTFSYSIVALDINILKIHRAFFSYWQNIARFLRESLQILVCGEPSSNRNSKAQCNVEKNVLFTYRYHLFIISD